MGFAEAYGRVWGRTGLAKAITAAVREATKPPAPPKRTMDTTMATFTCQSGHTWSHTYPRMLTPWQVRQEHCPECDALGTLERVEWRRSGTMQVA